MWHGNRKFKRRARIDLAVNSSRVWRIAGRRPDAAADGELWLSVAHGAAGTWWNFNAGTIQPSTWESGGDRVGPNCPRPPHPRDFGPLLMRRAVVGGPISYNKHLVNTMTFQNSTSVRLASSRHHTSMIYCAHHDLICNSACARPPRQMGNWQRKAV